MRTRLQRIMARCVCGQGSSLNFDFNFDVKLSAWCDFLCRNRRIENVKIEHWNLDDIY